MTIQLWHCNNARSLRPLWALEEMGLDYQLSVLEFPPRYKHKEFLTLNPLGTVPFFVDGDTKLTESVAMLHYLADRYQQDSFTLTVEHPEYGILLNWLYHSDATLTFPQTLYLRYAIFEAKERRVPQVAEDYRQWYLARLIMLDEHLKASPTFLCADKFTIADIAITYALYLGKLQGFDSDYSDRINHYLEQQMSREAFIKALALTQ